MDVDIHSPADKTDAKVVIVTNLTRNVVESHLKTIFGFYGHITKIDLPIFVKCGFICSCHYQLLTDIQISWAKQRESCFGVC